MPQAPHEHVAPGLVPAKSWDRISQVASTTSGQEVLFPPAEPVNTTPLLAELRSKFVFAEDFKLARCQAPTTCVASSGLRAPSRVAAQWTVVRSSRPKGLSKFGC